MAPPLLGRTKRDRRQEMEERLATKRREEKQVFDRWFEQLDTEVDRSELTQFITSLTNNVPSEESIDRMMNLSSKEELRAEVQKNMSYIKEQQYLDSIFDRYDVDGSGFLEPSEVKALMVAAAHGDVLHFELGDPNAHEAACLSYKLKCLDDLRAKGILADKEWREKRQSVASRHTALMSPSLSDRDPDDADVAFVLEQCDTNHDHKISREELLAAIGLWIQISSNSNQPSSPSKICSLM